MQWFLNEFTVIFLCKYAEAVSYTRCPLTQGFKNTVFKGRLNRNPSQQGFLNFLGQAHLKMPAVKSFAQNPKIASYELDYGKNDLIFPSNFMKT